MIQYILLFFLWGMCLCIPRRPSAWHGRLSSSTGATLTAACGQATTTFDNPWAAILYVDNYFQCGATILERDLAITAAHCLLNKNTEDLTLYYGKTFQPDSGIEDQGFRRFGGQTGISAVRIHPNYNTFDQYEGNDIALLKLSRRIRFNDYVKPIKVVPTHHKYDILYDRASFVRVAGFGQTKGEINSDDPDDWPNQMQLVEHRIVPEQTCNRGNSTYHFGPPQDGLCTRGKCRRKKNPGTQARFKQICPGDSGSGVVQYFQEDNRFYLLAVVSYTVTQDQKVCGTSSLPAVSIKTRDHTDFIYEDDFSISKEATQTRSPRIIPRTTPARLPNTPPTTPSPICSTEFVTECTTVIKQQCEEIYKQVCHTENETKCKTEENLTGIDTICDDVPSIWEDTTIPKRNRGRASIRRQDVLVTVCEDIPTQQCSNVPEEECSQVPKQICN